MQNIRQLIIKGDPMIRIRLPVLTLRLLEGAAKKNKRRVQDQFIKVLTETFKNDEALSPVLERFLPDLKEVYQQ